MTSTEKAPDRIWATPTNYRGWDVAVCSKTNVDGDSTAYIRADIHDALGADNEALRAERDQALAQLAAVQRGTIERCAKKVEDVWMDGEPYSEAMDHVLALPLDPDAEAALKRVVDAAVQAEREACADACLPHQDDDGMDKQAKAECRAAILARPTEGEHDV